MAVLSPVTTGEIVQKHSISTPEKSTQDLTPTISPIPIHASSFNLESKQLQCYGCKPIQKYPWDPLKEGDAIFFLRTFLPFLDFHNNW